MEAPAEDAKIDVVGLDELAERVVRLGLALGRHDPDYVDAYHGPEEWAEAAKAETTDLATLRAEADKILEALAVLNPNGADIRANALARTALAAKTRIRLAMGEKILFNDEARLLYGVTPPEFSAAQFDAALASLATIVPGEGALGDRIDAFRNSLAIPADKRQAVFDAAIAECRRRTLAHIDLPETERFSMSFVTDKPWSGYNWYQGDYASNIEINTDMPLIIDRAVDLGCHEGYPGHHVWNVIVERDLRRGRDWVEFSIVPLFNPQALLAEGSGNYGIELAFPGDEKLAFERDVLYPLAGLDPAKTQTLATINEARRTLANAGVWIARDYLDGAISRDEAVTRLMKYDFSSKARAEQRVDFFEKYRSYIINYSIGRDMVAAYIEHEKAAGVDPWDAFLALLRNPDAVSALAVD